MSLIDQIAQTLGDTNGTLITAIETSAIEHLDFELECQGTGHPREEVGHRLDQPATWVVTAPCGLELLKCNGWVNYVIAIPNLVIRCHCGAVHPVTLHRFIPLNPTDKP